MRKVYEGARVIELKRSYRSTTEIMELAKRVKSIPEIESIARHGAEPEILFCGDTVGVVARISEAIALFEQGEHKTLGIVHKSEALAQRYFELLSRDHDVTLLSQDSSEFRNGVSISSIKMAKGLEFDEVLVLDTDASHYCTDEDRNLLYVAITRAMHKLTILYRLNPTNFLAEE